MRIAVMILALFVPTTVSAQLYDSVVAGRDDTCLLITPPAVRSHEWVGGIYSRDTGVAAVAPGPNGQVIGAITSDAGFLLAEMRPDGSRVPLTVTFPGQPYAIVSDRARNMYALVPRTSSVAIVAFAPDGSVRATYQIAGSHFSYYYYEHTGLDLAADQCTLFFARGRNIERFDVCAGTSLPDFAGPEFQIAVRVLPDGGVISSSDYGLRRYDVNGTFVRSYESNGSSPFALMLSDDGRRLIYGTYTSECRGRLVVLDLASGAVISTRDLRLEWPTSVVTAHGWTAALGPAGTAEVPAASATSLFLLALVIVAVALIRLA